MKLMHSPTCKVCIQEASCLRACGTDARVACTHVSRLPERTCQELTNAQRNAAAVCHHENYVPVDHGVP